MRAMAVGVARRHDRSFAPAGFLFWRGVRLVRRKEGACRRHMTDEITPPDGHLVLKPLEGFEDRTDYREAEIAGQSFDGVRLLSEERIGIQLATAA